MTKLKFPYLVAQGDSILFDGMPHVVDAVDTKYVKRAGKFYIVHLTCGRKLELKPKDQLEVIVNG